MNGTGPNMFLLTAFVGMITFSIPFLWNAYQNMLDKKKYITGEKVENILSKEFYHKSIRFFQYFVQFPLGIVVFLGLIIVPALFPFELGIIFLTVAFLYFLFLPQIFQLIENKSSISLKVFLLDKEAESLDVLKAFKELWQRGDNEIEKEFSIKPPHVFEYFLQKIDQLLEKQKLVILRDYFNDFLTFIDNRSIIFVVGLNEVFGEILERHLQIWRKEYEYLSKEEKLDEWSNYSEISRILDAIFKRIEERSIREREAFSFFDHFKKHAEKYKQELVKGENGTGYYYIESLLTIFYQVFFENVETSPERYDIYEDYFPKEWKITKSNLESKKNIISRGTLDYFLPWAQERIWQAKEEFDRKLDDISTNLFPEVEPGLWAKILIFAFSLYGENRVKSAIERPWNFGFTGRVRTYWGSLEESEEEFNKRTSGMSRSAEKIETEKTFELVYYLAKRYPVFNQFSRQDLENYKNSLNELENTYARESKEERKRLRLLGLFTQMLEFLKKEEEQKL